jgi:RNA polymerase sigma-70 factor (ECF subfamily)
LLDLRGKRDETVRNDARDAATLERLVQGDADAVTDLYDRYAKPVYSLALRMLEDEAEAEHVVQEVFVEAWQQAARYTTARGTVPAWLLEITRARALARIRPWAPAAPNGIEKALLPRLALQPEQASRLRSQLVALPAVQRLAIEMAWFGGLGVGEIARRLDQPVEAITAYIAAGLFTLRDRLARPEAT